MAGGVYVVDLEGAAASGAGAAAGAAAEAALLIGAAAAAAELAPTAAFHSLTPPCPLQAPLLDAALVEVPSLHVPVGAAAGAAAFAA